MLQKHTKETRPYRIWENINKKWVIETEENKIIESRGFSRKVF
jgi:hypothetical protein